MMWRKKGRWTSYESISRRYVVDDDCTTTTTQSTATKAATTAKTPLQSWRWSWSRSVSRRRCVLDDDDCTTTTTRQIPLTTRSKAAATAKTIGGPSFKPLESLRWSWSRRVLSMSSALRRMSTIRRATEEEAQEFCVLKLTLRTFSLSELKRATRNFSRDNVVGRGGFAKVYCGSLPGGQLVAVKRLMAGEGRDTLEGFLAELGHVVNVSHPNIARLVGVGVDGGEYLLVFPFSRLGCLSGKLHGSGAAMPWAARHRVALGTARGLEYLHERCARRIVHRDIKPANILLMDNYEPLICDFGLARWLPAQLTHLQVSVFEGTFGYVPPEYTTHGVFSEKTDVFAFGVVLLELLTGRRAVNAANKLSLVSWARPFLDGDDEVLKLVDPALGGEYSDEQLRDVAWAANLCVNASPDHRPRMSEVLKILKGAGSSRRQARNQLHGNDYDAARYADDLSRHKKLAFDFDAE